MFIVQDLEIIPEMYIYIYIYREREREREREEREKERAERYREREGAHGDLWDPFEAFWKIF